MEMFLDSDSDEEEFEGFPCEPVEPASKRELDNKALESSEEEDDDDDDSDDFKGLRRKRKALEAFESDDDEDSRSDGDDASSNDEEAEDDDDTDDDDEDGIETEDTLEMDLNEDDDDVPSNSDQCPICLMSLGGQKLGTPSECQHVFCFACIMEWSKNANTCPVDRKVFHQILVHSTKKGPILERIPVEDRRVPEVGWEQEPTYCEVCNECDREDRMLLCDGCDKGYHLECLMPRLYTVPAGSWYCTTCIEIRRGEQMEEEGDSVPELLPGNVRRSRGTAPTSTRSETSSETDGPQRARTAATNRRRSTSTRGRGRGRGRTGSRSSGRGRSRSRTTGRSRTGSSTRRGRGGKRKTKKRAGRTASTTGKPKRKKRKTTTTKKKRRSTTKSKAKKRKVDRDENYRNPFEGQSFRGRTSRERINNSLRASGSTSDVGRGLGMTSGLSIFGDHYALDGFEDESTNEPEQSDSSNSVKSANSDVLGSIFDGIETLHDENATVSRDGRVLPSESPDKKSSNKESQIKAAESSSSQKPCNLSRDGSDVASPPRDLKHGNSSCDHSEGHVTSMETNQSRQMDMLRDGATFTTLSRDHTGYKPEPSMIPPLDIDTKGKRETNKNYQTDSQNVDASSNKPNEKYNTPIEQIGGASSEYSNFENNSQNNFSATPNHHKIPPDTKLNSVLYSKLPSAGTVYSSSSGSSSKRSLEPPTASENGPSSKPSSVHSCSGSSSKSLTSPKTHPKIGISSKLPSSPLADSSSGSSLKSSLGQLTPPESCPSSKPSPPAPARSSSGSTSKRPQNRPLHSASETHVRFKIPKKTSHSLDTSFCQKSPSPGTLTNKSYSPQDSKVSRTGIPDGPIPNTPVSPKNSQLIKRVSPILWTDKDNERNKLPEFKVEKDTCRTKPTAICPKARLIQTPPANKEMTSSGDRKTSSSSDFLSSARNLKEKNKGKSKLCETKLEDLSHRSAFSQVTKIKEEKISDVKEYDVKSTGENSVLRNQSPNFNSRPSLQELPSTFKTSSPLSKVIGPRSSSSGLTGSSKTGSSGKAEIRRSYSPLSRILGPRPSTGKTGSAATSLSGKTEKHSSPGQDGRVIEFSKEKGELKIKVVPSQDETHSAVRSLPEEAHPALRSLPEEAHPSLRSLPSNSNIDPTHPPLNTVQPFSSLKPLKPVARQPPRPRLKMLSTSETTQPGTLTSGVQASRDSPNRTKQNLAIIQMLQHKKSTLKSEVEKGHSPLREELESTRRETPEIEPDSPNRSRASSCSTVRTPLEDSLEQHEMSTNRPKLSSLFGSPRNSNLPVAVVRPSLSSVNRNQTVSFAGFVSSDASDPQSVEAERERNRKKGIARLQRIERIKSVVKASLQPYYDHHEITKQDFKEIFIRAVDKVKDSNHEVERNRIAALIKKYVKMFKGLRLIGTNQDSDL